MRFKDKWGRIDKRPHSSSSVSSPAPARMTMEQVVDVPDDAEEKAQQRTIEQIVSVGTATEAATTTPLDSRSKVRVLAHARRASRARTCPLRATSRTTLQVSQRALGGTPAASSARRVPFRRRGFSGPRSTQRRLQWLNTLLLHTPYMQRQHP